MLNNVNHSNVCYSFASEQIGILNCKLHNCSNSETLNEDDSQILQFLLASNCPDVHLKISSTDNNSNRTDKEETKGRTYSNVNSFLHLL